MTAEDIATILTHGFIRKIKDDEARDPAKFNINILNWDCYKTPNSYRPGVFGYIRYLNGQFILNSIDWPEKWNISTEDVAAFVKHNIMLYVAGNYDVNFDKAQSLMVDFSCEDNDYD